MEYQSTISIIKHWGNEYAKLDDLIIHFYQYLSETKNEDKILVIKTIIKQLEMLKD